MKKIISLFQRNYDDDRLVRNEVVPGAEWVLDGLGTATRKFDGTCCLIRDGKLYKRYEIKVGGKAPPNFESANEVDEATGKQQGWVPVGDGPDDKWHRVGLDNLLATQEGRVLEPEVYLAEGDLDGTYELCGPKIQGNQEKLLYHTLIPHGCEKLPLAPRNYDGIKDFLSTADIEGIVWHHEDGRMAKIKKRDFGFKR